MTDKNDGGPAFPFEGGANNGYSPDPGMTVRDCYAGQAMIGLIANPCNKGSAAEVARLAFGIADAMLIERSKT